MTTIYASAVALVSKHMGAQLGMSNTQLDSDSTKATTSSTALQNIFSIATRAPLAVLGTTYALGFVALNSHLAKFGVSDLDFVNGRYLLAGVNAAFFSLCFYVFAGRFVFLGPTWLKERLLAVRGFDAQGVARSRLWTSLSVGDYYLGFIFFCCLSSATYVSIALGQRETGIFYLVLAGAFFVDYPIKTAMIHTKFPRSNLVLDLCIKSAAIVAFCSSLGRVNLLMVGAIYLSVALFVNFVVVEFKTWSPSADRLWVTVAYSAVAVLTFTVTFGAAIYGHVATEIGGARPLRAIVIIAPDRVDGLGRLLTLGRSGTFEAPLIHETSKGLFFQIGTRTVRLRLEDVLAISFEPEEKSYPFGMGESPALQKDVKPLPARSTDGQSAAPPRAPTAEPSQASRP